MAPGSACNFSKLHQGEKGVYSKYLFTLSHHYSLGEGYSMFSIIVDLAPGSTRVFTFGLCFSSVLSLGILFFLMSIIILLPSAAPPSLIFWHFGLIRARLVLGSFTWKGPHHKDLKQLHVRFFFFFFMIIGACRKTRQQWYRENFRKLRLYWGLVCWFWNETVSTASSVDLNNFNFWPV